MKWNPDFESFINSVIENISEGLIIYNRLSNNILFYNAKSVEILMIKSGDISTNILSKLSVLINKYEKSCEDIVFESHLEIDKEINKSIKAIIFPSIFKDILVIKVASGKDYYEDEKSMESISFLLKQNHKLVSIINNKSIIEFVNSTFLETFDFTIEEIIGSNILTFVSQLSEFQNIRIWKKISEGFVWKGEIKTANKKGDNLYLLASIIPIKIEETIEKFVIVADDITMQKQSELKLVEAEKKRNIILNALPDTILVIDKKGYISEFKSETEKELFINDVIINKKITEIGFPQDFSNKIINALKFTLKSKKIKQFNYNHKERHYECRLIALNEHEVVCFIRCITKRVIAEKILKTREKSYKSMVENFPSGLIIQKNNRLFYANKTALKYLGCKNLNELRKYNIFELVPEDKRDKVKKRIQSALEGKNVPFMEFPIRKISNNKYYIFETKPVLFDYYGEKVCQIVMRDLTVQKHLIKETLRAEMAEKLNMELQNEMEIRTKMEQTLINSLQEKEELIKEIHHRVKNNMQVMTSILNLQANLIEDENVKQIFEESQNRIKSMALVHEIIYSSKSFTKIDFERYIVALTDNLFRSYERKEKNIEIKFKINNFYLPVTLAVPCGLIINEIISFSIKRFFVEISKKYIIFVEANLINNEVQIFISDDGQLIKDKNILSSPKSLGFQLIMALVDQLSGSITFNNKQQNKFSIFFNI